MTISPEIGGMFPYGDPDILLFPEPVHESDFDRLNADLEKLTARERIEWAFQRFGSGLFVLSSFGIDSALTIHESKQVAENLNMSPLKVVHINTGFLPHGTISHRDALRQRDDFDLYETGPSEEETEYILQLDLWKNNLAEYREYTKLGPLKDLVQRYNITALISGIRRDQSPDRSELQYINQGKFGEIRINPFADMTNEEVMEYFRVNQLPHHPLFYDGHKTLDDWTIMGEDNYIKNHCGLHVLQGGKID